jgi:hypothetical protein
MESAVPSGRNRAFSIARIPGYIMSDENWIQLTDDWFPLKPTDTTGRSGSI